MKNLSLLLLLFAIFILASCGVDKKLIGDINMISERNIDSNIEYVELKRYAGTGKKAAKMAAKEETATLQDAVDVTVKGVPGGEYIRNAKIFMIDGKFYLVEGDVWGVNKASFAGFRAGDRVLYDKDKQGTIQSLVNNRECMILFDEDEIPKKIRYDDIVKI